MPANNNDTSKKYLVPRKIQEETLRATIENTLSQIANAELQAANHKRLANKEPDKQKREKLNLKRQQLLDGRELNYAFLEMVGYQPGDEKRVRKEQVDSVFKI